MAMYSAVVVLKLMLSNFLGGQESPTSVANVSCQRQSPTSFANVSRQLQSPTSVAKGSRQHHSPTSVANVCRQRQSLTSVTNASRQRQSPTKTVPCFARQGTVLVLWAPLFPASPPTMLLPCQHASTPPSLPSTPSPPYLTLRSSYSFFALVWAVAALSTSFALSPPY